MLSIAFGGHSEMFILSLGFKVVISVSPFECHVAHCPHNGTTLAKGDGTGGKVGQVNWTSSDIWLTSDAAVHLWQQVCR